MIYETSLDYVAFDHLPPPILIHGLQPRQSRFGVRPQSRFRLRHQPVDLGKLDLGCCREHLQRLQHFAELFAIAGHISLDPVLQLRTAFDVRRQDARRDLLGHVIRKGRAEDGGPDVEWRQYGNTPWVKYTQVSLRCSIPVKWGSERVFDRRTRIGDVAANPLHGFAGREAKDSDYQSDTGHVGAFLKRFIYLRLTGAGVSGKTGLCTKKGVDGCLKFPRLFDV